MEPQAYTDTKLVECNRLSSVEYQAGNYGNNAIFTNKLNTGIKLDVGDQISMETAIVSDLGAGNDTIELKGQSLKKTKKFQYTKVRTVQALSGGQKNNLAQFSAQYIEPTEEEIELKDNEANISVTYYKTANGENCFGLPRRFGYNSALVGKNLFRSNDCVANGATEFQIHKGTFVDEDYYRDRSASAVFNNDPFLNRELYKIRQDGTKYTIFGRRNTFASTASGSIEPARNKNGSYDPALDEYNKFIELKKITIPKGRRSADFIAERVTRTLQNASDPKTFIRALNNNVDTGQTFENQGVLTSTLKSETFKPFTAQCYNNFDETLFNEFNSTTFNIQTLTYLKGYQYIAVKRPEFVEAGRATRNGSEPDTHLVTKITFNEVADRKRAAISINVAYTEANLEKLSRFLKSQELFPEFWSIVTHPYSPYFQSNASDIEITIDNSRFFHMDQQNRYSAARDHAALHYDFGSDLYGNASYENIPSQPLFFYYDKSQENTFYKNPFFISSEDNNLSYGCFNKDAEGKVVIHPNGLTCGIPADYYNKNGFFVGNNSNPSYSDFFSRVYIGYDFHWSGFGNAAMGLWAGYDYQNYSDNKRIGLRTINQSGTVIDSEVMTSIVDQIYLGAPDPKLTYDSSKDRYGWTGFYTPEFVGNMEGAGEDTINKIVDGGAQCYKINKRLRRNQYSPGMLNNQALDNASYVTSTNGSSEKAWELPNKCIYPFSIIDSQSGIRIENFGYDEEDWDNGLFSILGFKYNQLQAPLTASNSRSARISDVNFDSLNTMTNQAEIKPGDILTYNQNQFGAIYYDSRVKAAELLPMINPTRDFPWNAPINIETSSNIITAESVPKQMLKPMYVIRSDILEDSNAYLGSNDSGQALSTIGYVMKNYNQGDYFFGQESSVTFTVTRPKLLTHITTSVTDPDGTYSNVDDSSVVIYKIQKQRELPGNIVAQILNRRK
jgi:hypothetical protein